MRHALRPLAANPLLRQRRPLAFIISYMSDPLGDPAHMGDPLGDPSHTQLVVCPVWHLALVLSGLQALRLPAWVPMRL